MFILCFWYWIYQQKVEMVLLAMHLLTCWCSSDELCTDHFLNGFLLKLSGTLTFLNICLSYIIHCRKLSLLHAVPCFVLQIFQLSLAGLHSILIFNCVSKSHLYNTRTATPTGSSGLMCHKNLQERKTGGNAAWSSFICLPCQFSRCLLRPSQLPPKVDSCKISSNCPHLCEHPFLFFTLSIASWIFTGLRGYSSLSISFNEIAY